MKPPTPRVFADIGQMMFDARTPDHQQMLAWGGIRLTAGDFKLAFAAYHGVSLGDFDLARSAADERRAANIEGDTP